MKISLIYFTLKKETTKKEYILSLLIFSVFAYVSKKLKQAGAIEK